VGTGNLDLPETVFETEGLWFEFEDFVPASLDQGQHYMGGIHAIEHAAIGLFPLVALCDRDDMGGISYPMHPEIEKGAVFIYDGHAGGVGLAKAGFKVLEELLTRTLDLVSSCECESGCPSCIHSPKCGSGNKPLDKSAAVRVLEVLLDKRAIEISSELDQSGIEIMDDDRKPAKPPEPRLMVFDLETSRSAAEVGGWGNAHLMGIAAGVVYDVRYDKYHVFQEEKIQELVDLLLEADLIIGFNHIKFDYQVLSAYTSKNLKTRPNLDLLVEVYAVLGWRVSLDKLVWATLSREKTADGLQSLEWVKEGRLDLVEEYCREDVHLTYDLFTFARENHYLLFDDKEGRRMRIPLDLNLERFLKTE
jgi:DEAD/DEAH box helicase domain-containing protein